MDYFECVEKVIKERRSCRVYEEKDVEDWKIKKIIELAMWAPSAMNRQQWYFVVVKGQKLKEVYRALEKSFDYILPRLERFFAKTPKVITFTKQFFKSLDRVPVIIFVYYIPTGDDYSDLQSVSAAIQNMLLAAHALGLGTCWMTGPIHMEDEINRVLGVEDKKLVAAVTVGYPAKKPPTPPRRDVDKKVVWLN